MIHTKSFFFFFFFSFHFWNPLGLTSKTQPLIEHKYRVAMFLFLKKRLVTIVLKTWGWLDFGTYKSAKHTHLQLFRVAFILCLSWCFVITWLTFVNAVYTHIYSILFSLNFSYLFLEWLIGIWRTFSEVWEWTDIEQIDKNSRYCFH